jgi:hypothetical protein
MTEATDKEDVDEEKAARLFNEMRLQHEPPKYTAEWYRELYPHFPDNFYEVFEKYSASDPYGSCPPDSEEK